MAALTGRVAGRTSSSTVDKEKNENEGKNKDGKPLQTSTPNIKMTCDKLLETVEL
jgi:hypothetical protein